MMRVGLAALLLLLSVPAARAGLCDENNALVEREFDADFSHGFLEHIELPRVRYGVEYHENIYLHLGSDGGTSLHGVYDWQTDKVGLAYSLYRLEITIGRGDDQQKIEQDYTGDCQGVPPELWPGGRLQLNPIEILPHANGSPRTTEHVSVRVWVR